MATMDDRKKIHLSETVPLGKNQTAKSLFMLLFFLDAIDLTTFFWLSLPLTFAEASICCVLIDKIIISVWWIVKKHKTGTGWNADLLFGLHLFSYSMPK